MRDKGAEAGFRSMLETICLTKEQRTQSMDTQKENRVGKGTLCETWTGTYADSWQGEITEESFAHP